MKYKFCFKKGDNIEKRESSFFCGISTREGISANPLELELAERIIRGFINDVKGFSVSLDEIFTSLKISCRDCILLGMPIYYEKNIFCIGKFFVSLFKMWARVISSAPII